MLNNDQIKKIASLPDEYLKDRLSVVVNSVGGGNVNISDDDIKRIKETVLSMSADDVSNIMAGIDKNKIDKIKKALSDK